MGFEILQFGNHKSVACIDFGAGDIFVTPAADIDVENRHMIIFSVGESGEVGREIPEIKGKSSDEIENVKVIFRFTDPKSICVLVDKLMDVQEALLNKK